MPLTLQYVPTNPADLEAVTLLLGREPRAEFEVVVRGDNGEPVVLRNASLMYDSTPMPTLYWLVDPITTFLSSAALHHFRLILPLSNLKKLAKKSPMKQSKRVESHRGCLTWPQLFTPPAQPANPRVVNFYTADLLSSAKTQRLKFLKL